MKLTLKFLVIIATISSAFHFSASAAKANSGLSNADRSICSMLSGEIKYGLSPGEFFESKSKKCLSYKSEGNGLGGPVGWGLLHFAARHNRSGAAKALVSNKFDLEAKTADKDGFTALHLAAIDGHTELVRFLLEEGAQINAKDRRGFNAFNHAVLNGRKG